MNNPIINKIEFKEICIGCELEGEKYVERRGTIYCANPLCTSVGATQHKVAAPGVYPNGNVYTIKDFDFFWDWCQEQYEKETDLNIKVAMERTLPIWKKRYEEWFAEYGERAKIKHLIDVVDS